MIFALGYIAGVVTCTFIFAVIVAVKGERYVDRASNVIREAAKRDYPVVGKLPLVPRGFVETPPDDDEIARQEIIEENRAKGRDTHISELSS